jgi:uncharacterized protein
MKAHATQLLFGVAFGFVFSAGGFSDWQELMGMFRLREWSPALTFATVLVVTAPVWLWLERRGARKLHKPVHPGSIPGGIIFGVGWAIAGGCPALVMVQLGEGKGMALCTLLGILLGNWLYSLVHERYFRWAATSCADD